MTEKPNPDTLPGSSEWWRPLSSPLDSSSTGAELENPPAQAQQQLGTQQSPPSIPANRSSVAVACITCRSRHLKCDGGVRCSRCAQEGIQCSYIKSRRGWKGPRKADRSAAIRKAVMSNGQPAFIPQVLEVPLPDSGVALTPGLEDASFIQAFGAPPESDALAVVTLPGAEPVADTTSAGLIGAFYSFFHSSHPFLLPRFHMTEFLKKESLPHIELAMKYIGSCYVPSVAREQLRNSLQQVLFSPSLTRDGFSVQSLLLLAIGLHIEHDVERYMPVFHSALKLALEIGMHKNDFATNHGSGSAVLEESWRRTWWECYILDAMFTGITPNTSLQVQHIPADVYLPCEERDYLHGQIPPLRSLRDYDDALFAEDGAVYSSFTYLVDAARMLAKVINATRASAESSADIEFAEKLLANWSLHLPEPKCKPVNREGHVDEVLFQAHMIANATAIMLHRPRSDLNFEDVKDVTTCISTGQTLPASYREMHTASAMQAADNISNLISLPCPLIKHTPFLTCACTMSAVVYLSYWSFIATDGADTVIKEQIRLSIGVLQTLADRWPVAQAVLDQVKGVAKELFASRKSTNTPYWSSVTQDEIITGMIEERDRSSSEQSQFQEFLTL